MNRPSALFRLSLLASFGCGMVFLVMGREAPPSSGVQAEFSPQERPLPTLHPFEEDAEERLSQQRKAWRTSRHRAPPGVDWEEMERLNAERSLLRRNELKRLRGAEVGPPRWVERGSANQAGRMHQARFSSDGAWIYAGSSGGGIWKGRPDGSEWIPLGDNLYGGVHSQAVLPGEVEGAPDLLLVSTDWGSVHRSVDEGATWQQPEGLPYLTSTRRLLVTSDASHTVFLLGCAWDNCSVWKSADRGSSFTEVLDLEGYPGDVWAPRDGGSMVYLLAREELLRSDDLGESFDPVGILSAASSSGELAGSEAGAPRLWAVLSRPGGVEIHRSDDGGANFLHVNDASDYWGTLEASAVDEDLFVLGGLEVHVTRDGGIDFERVNNWGDYYSDPANLLHADLMGLDALPHGDGTETWFIGTDGGLYRSLDGMDTVANLSLSGLRVGQYYSTLTSRAFPDHLAVGAQDQGYQRTFGAEQAGDILRFNQEISGDYGHLSSGDWSHEWVFSTYPGFILVQHGEENLQLYYLEFPPDELYEWLPPVVADPKDPRNAFFPATHLYYYNKNGVSNWERISASEHDFSGDGDFLSAMTFSPLDNNRAWVASARGKLYRSEDHAVTWQEAEDRGPDAHYFYGTALLASRTDVDTVWAGGSGYGSPAVYRSKDGGRTWEDFGQGLPDTLVYSLAEAPDGSGTLFAGTETSAWMREEEAKEWKDITGIDAPLTVYWSAETLVAENTIRFGTYGRGIWDYQLDPKGEGCYPPVDRDGDGVPCDTDCDDTNPSILPGAKDVCDGTDVNCNATDILEVDADQDGYLACEECNDGTAAAHPGATEVCDSGIDEDCDGTDPPCGEGEGGDDDDGDEPVGCGCGSLSSLENSPQGEESLLAWTGLGMLLLRRRKKGTRMPPPGKKSPYLGGPSTSRR